jgi:DNA invertase Pin-like site-specific DNA recombinase
MAKAYSYTRFSSPEQAEGDSLPRQLRMAREWCRRHDVELDTTLTFHDAGVSAFRGKNAAAAGALRAFLRAVEDGMVEQGDYLLVEALDRVSRQAPRKALRLIEEIIESGVFLVTLSNGKVWSEATIDGSDWFLLSGELFRGNDESVRKSQRNAEAWKSKRARALASGKRMTTWGPSWLKPDGKGWKVIPEHAAIVRRIYAEHIAGHGAGGIAARLNEEGVPPFTANGREGVNVTSPKRQAKMWHRSFIKRILDDPRTIGDLPLYERLEGGRKRVEVDRAKGYYPAVIDLPTWEQAQALHFSRSPRRGMHAKKPLKNIFGGLVRCSRCGGSMYRLNHGSTHRGAYLLCRRAHASAGCELERIHYEPALELFLHHLPDELREAPAGLELDEALEAARQTVAGLEDMGEALASKIARGKAPPTEARILGEALDQARAELAELETQAEVSHGRTVRRRLRELEQAIRAEPIDVELVNSLLRQTFSSMVLDFDAGEIVCHWRHAGSEARVPFTAAAYGFEVQSNGLSPLPLRTRR